MTNSRNRLAEVLADNSSNEASGESKVEKVMDPLYEQADKLIAVDKEVLDKLTKAVNQLDQIIQDKKKNTSNDTKLQQLLDREKKCTQIIKEGINSITIDLKTLNKLKLESKSSAVKTMIQNRTALFKKDFNHFTQQYSDFQMRHHFFSSSNSSNKDQVSDEYQNNIAELQKLDLLQDTHDRITDRHEEILELARKIHELANLFQDLNTLVNEQDELLNSIDHHIEKALEKTKKGAEEVESARKYQKKNRCLQTGMLVTLVTAAGVGAGIGLKNS